MFHLDMACTTFLLDLVYTTGGTATELTQLGVVPFGFQSGGSWMADEPANVDDAFLKKLRAGDEAAFSVLVDELHGGLLGFARTFTSSPALAEDIVQETWLAVIRGLSAFEGRASLKTWIYSILVRRARTLAARDAKQSGGWVEAHTASNEVEWEPGQGRRGLWDDKPVPWAYEDPATVYQSHEVLEVLQLALDTLPEVQRQVVVLRDVEGLPASDVCNILELSETNQRVVLHRGRARLRKALDRYLRDGTKPQFPTEHSGGRDIR
ncbi:MAG TPA: RNA polymerase sigma factor [Candidatus Eisenbacteria bacterium]|nr:RNA polymerase sigma factor [Candidatus Eisenbacteria bacterium]